VFLSRGSSSFYRCTNTITYCEWDLNSPWLFEIWRFRSTEEFDFSGNYLKISWGTLSYMVLSFVSFPYEQKSYSRQILFQMHSLYSPVWPVCELTTLSSQALLKKLIFNRLFKITYWARRFNRHFHTIPWLCFVPSQINSAHTLPTSFSKIQCNISIISYLTYRFSLIQQQANNNYPIRCVSCTLLICSRLGYIILLAL